MRVGAFFLFSFLFVCVGKRGAGEGFDCLSGYRVRYVPEVKLIVVVTRISVQFCSVRGYSFVW